MAKQVCEICNAEVGFLQQVKMRDDNYVCNKCAGKTHPLFEPVNVRTLQLFNEHRKQLEDGKILYEKLFVPRKNAAEKAQKLKKFSGGMEVAKDIGLISVSGKRGGFLFWGGTPYYMVFRIADLYKYDYSSVTTRSSDGKTVTKHYINFIFLETPGLDRFRIDLFNTAGFVSTAGFFDECFGIKRDLRSLTNPLKNQIANVKTAVQGIKTLLSGDKEVFVEQMWQAEIDQLYGERAEWIAKAETAIKSVISD